MKKSIIFLSILFFLTLLQGKDCGEAYAQCNTWTQKTNFGGTARNNAAGFSIGAKGYIGIGWDGTYKKDFWEYDPGSDTWTQKADFDGVARNMAIGFSIGSKGYIGTGGNAGGGTNDFWEYDLGSNTWTQKANFGGVLRTQAKGFSIGDKGYIGTGWNGGVTKYKDFWEYNSLTDTWAQKADFGGSARRMAVAFSIGGKGYIGTGYDNVVNLSDFWEYDTTSNTWSPKADFGGTARRVAVGFSIGNKGYIGTGYDTANKQDFWEYDPGTDTWTQKANFGGTVRGGAAGFSIGSKGYIGTGGDGVNKQDFWEYIPELTANAGTDTSVICAGDSVIIGGSPTTLGGNGIYTYSWTPSTGLNNTTLANPIASPSNTTTYFVTVTDSNGCVAIDSMKLSVFSSGIQTSPIIGLTNVNVIAIENYSVAFHAGSIYDWSVIGGNQTNGGQTNFISIQWGTMGTGQITVVETDSLLCIVDTAALTVNIGGTGINENQRANIGINIYPNPNTGEFIIEFKNLRGLDIKIKLFSITGKLIYKEKLNNIQRNYQKKIDLNAYPKGIYTLKLISNEGVINKKIMVE